MTERPAARPQPLEKLVDALRSAGLLIDAPHSASGAAITGVRADSRAVQPGELFCAVRGTVTDGHEFVTDAVARGAAAVVVERTVDVSVPAVIVIDGQEAARIAGQTWYDRPGDRLRLIGVTGTNGKTTTVALIRHVLNHRGTAASIGTLGAIAGSGEAVPSTAGVLTTPGPVDLQATLAEFVKRGTTDVALEASSHSLDQGRLDGLALAAGVFTNLSRDHLDYHTSMEDYLAAKMRLATCLGLDGVEVVNRDDASWERMPVGARRVTFGLHPSADVTALVHRVDASGSRFQLAGRFGQAWVDLPLLGDFNVPNALGAAACALALDEPIRRVADRLSDMPPVPGRMEVISRHPCLVIRDYAHTPDALARALTTLRPLVGGGGGGGEGGRLVVVFGCGGDRDRGKRPMMGQVAAELAGQSYVTSDNPRSEDPARIVDDIERGMGDAPRRRVLDRRQAILDALGACRPDDILLLAGKGHETYQVLGTTRVPFDEKQIVLEAVAGP